MQRTPAPKGRNISSPAIHGGDKERREYSVAGRKAISSSTRLTNHSTMPQRRNADMLFEADSKYLNPACIHYGG
ncbi:MAG: hypothetical protein HY738_16150 [Bacteroidia bacterium]|nr:hypothetical protein [Bacteroidia bacterium]